MKQWQAKQEVSGGTDRKGELQLNLNSTTVAVAQQGFWGGVATLAAAAVNCFNEFPMQIA